MSDPLDPYPGNLRQIKLDAKRNMNLGTFSDELLEVMKAMPPEQFEELMASCRPTTFGPMQRVIDIDLVDRLGMTKEEAVKYLENAILDYQKDPWIKLADQTPPDGEVLLAGYAYNDPARGEHWRRIGYYAEGRLYEDDGCGPWEGHLPTHWTPLPNPPGA